MRLTRQLILASSSPRRAALLAQVGLSFQIIVAHSAEPPIAPGADLHDWVVETATVKAAAVADTMHFAEPVLILAADTAVVIEANGSPDTPRLDGSPVILLGKPRDGDDAARMLTLLSGREHTVMTAFALLTLPERQLNRATVQTRVRFRHLPPAEIATYVATGEPLDKAGAYGIQGRGAVLITGITGDYYTVVGLPLARLWVALAPWMSAEDQGGG